MEVFATQIIFNIVAFGDTFIWHFSF